MKKKFHQVIQQDIRLLSKDKVKSGGYVNESLEASLWSFLNTESFGHGVLTPINFGHDTDTTGAITGGLAARCSGSEKIPRWWIWITGKDGRCS